MSRVTLVAVVVVMVCAVAVSQVQVIGEGFVGPVPTASERLPIMVLEGIEPEAVGSAYWGVRRLAVDVQAERLVAQGTVVGVTALARQVAADQIRVLPPVPDTDAAFRDAVRPVLGVDPMVDSRIQLTVPEALPLGGEGRPVAGERPLAARTHDEAPSAKLLATTCGNASYDEGTTESASWFNGGQAGNPDNMFGVRFELDDFGFLPGQTEITGFCAGNDIDYGGPWPNQVFIYPDSGGTPNAGSVLGQGTIYTGDGDGQYSVTLSQPVLLNGDFWLMSRGAAQWTGEDFNMEFDNGPNTGHSYASSSGIGGLSNNNNPGGNFPNGVNYILRAQLQQASGSSGCNLAITGVDTSSCPQVTLTVAPTDDQGNGIPNLGPSNFSLTEDGSSRSISVSCGGTSTAQSNVTLVIDESGSLTSSNFALEIQAARNLVNLLPSGTNMSVYLFDNDVRLVQDWTTSRSTVLSALDSVSQGGGDTALYDAMVTSSQHYQGLNGQRLTVLFTDGENTTGSNTLSDGIAAAQSNQVTIFTVGFGNADQTVLQQIATDTGGLFFFGSDASALDQIANQIGSTIASQCTITYTSPNCDGNHNVRVELDTAGCTASATRTVTLDCCGGTPGGECSGSGYGSYPAQTAWRTGDGTAGDSDYMLGTRFDLSDFGYSAGQAELAGYCIPNTLSINGGPWTNEVYVYPDSGGLPNTSQVLSQVSVSLGDGTGSRDIQVLPPVQLNSDFWIVLRGNPNHTGENFNLEGDAGPNTGESYVSTSGPGSMTNQWSTTNYPNGANFLLRADLQSSAGGCNLNAGNADTTNCPEVSFTVSATDDNGNPITNLGPGNFSLTEDGSNRSITVDCGSSSGGASNVTLVIDESGSLTSANFALEVQAAKDLVNLLPSGTNISVYLFDNDVRLVRDWTTNKSAVISALNGVSQGGGDTALYDAMVTSSQHYGSLSGQRLTVLFTDGDNTTGSNTLSNGISAAQSNGVTMFTVGFGNANQSVLQQIANDTGGLFFFGSDASALSQIASQIGAIVSSQCVITYTSPYCDGTHTVVITFTSPGCTDTATRSVTLDCCGSGTGDDPGGSGGDACTPNAYRYIVPSGGHLPGAAGTNWVSDLSMFNEGGSTSSLTVFLLERGRDNRTTVAFDTSIGSRRSRSELDVFLSRYGRSNVAGGLWICSSQALQVTSRTFNNAAGTFGQGIPGYPRSQAIQPGQIGRMIFLYENSQYRTNIGFTNTTAQTISVTADLYSESGTLLGSRSYSVPPFSHIQRNRIFGEVTGSSIANGTVEVRGSGAFFAYASLVDNFSGDPTYLAAEK